MTKRHRLTVSVNHEAIVAGAAALHNKTPKAYLEEIITEVCMPEVVAGMGAAPLAPAAGEPEEPEEPKPNKRKPKRVKGRNRDGSTDLRTVKVWDCPVCAKRLTMTGAKVHFVTCALKIGLTVPDIVEYIVGDTVLTKGYAAATKTKAELEAIVQTCVDRFGHSWESFAAVPPGKVRLREIKARHKTTKTKAS